MVVNGIEVPTPNLDKISEAADTRDGIQDFLEWLSGYIQVEEEDGALRMCLTVREGTRLCTYIQGPGQKHRLPRALPKHNGDRCIGGEILDENGDITLTYCWRCKGTGHVPGTVVVTALDSDRNRERVMAGYLGVDLYAAEMERMAMLKALRNGG